MRSDDALKFQNDPNVKNCRRQNRHLELFFYISSEMEGAETMPGQPVLDSIFDLGDKLSSTLLTSSRT